MGRATLARWLLPASLAINAFLIFVMIGWRSHEFRPPPPPSPAEMAERMAAILPPEDGTILRDTFAARADALTRGRNVHATVPARLRAILESPESDADALKAVFADARTAREAMDASFEGAMIEAVGKMSPAGRRKLAEWEPPGPPRP